MNLIETTRRPMRWPKRRTTSVACWYPITESLFRWRYFFLLYCEINLSKMQFYFPLITNSNSRRKTGPFFSFMWQTSQLSGTLRTQTLLMNFYSLRLLFKNKGSTHPDFKATVRTKYSWFATKDNLQKSGNDSRMMATKNVTGGGTQTKTFQRLLCSPLWVGESKQQSL